MALWENLLSPYNEQTTHVKTTYGWRRSVNLWTSLGEGGGGGGGGGEEGVGSDGDTQQKK